MAGHGLVRFNLVFHTAQMTKSYAVCTCGASIEGHAAPTVVQANESARDLHRLHVEQATQQVRCPGSGQPTWRIHPSGALVCPSCNGAIFGAGTTTLPDHMVMAEQP